MFGLDASLAPRVFKLAVTRPSGLIIGYMTQFGIMPVLAYVLCLVFSCQLAPEYAAPVAIGALHMRAVPAGTTPTMRRIFRRATSHSAS